MFLHNYSGTMMEDLQEYGRDLLADPTRSGEDGYCCMCGVHPHATPSRQLFTGSCECQLCVHCFGSYCLAEASQECPAPKCRMQNSFVLHMETETMNQVLGTVFSRLEEAEERLENLCRIQMKVTRAKRADSNCSTVMVCPNAKHCKFKLEVGTKYENAFKTIPGVRANKNLKIVLNGCANTVPYFRNTNPFKTARGHIRECMAKKLGREVQEDDLPLFYRLLSSYPDYKAVRYKSKAVTPNSTLPLAKEDDGSIAQSEKGNNRDQHESEEDERSEEDEMSEEENDGREREGEDDEENENEGGESIESPVQEDSDVKENDTYRMDEDLENECQDYEGSENGSCAPEDDGLEKCKKKLFHQESVSTRPSLFGNVMCMDDDCEEEPLEDSPSNLKRKPKRFGGGRSLPTNNKRKRKEEMVSCESSMSAMETQKRLWHG